MGTTAAINFRHRQKPTPQMAKCPNRDQHTEGPDRYLWFDGWAKQMETTHRQSRCPGCGLYVIWTPLDRDESGGAA